MWKGSGTRSSVRANWRYESAAVGGIIARAMGGLYNSFTSLQHMEFPWGRVHPPSIEPSLKYFPKVQLSNHPNATFGSLLIANPVSSSPTFFFRKSYIH